MGQDGQAGPSSPSPLERSRSSLPSTLGDVPTARLQEIVRPTVQQQQQQQKRGKLTLTNWGGSFVCRPKVLLAPTSVEQCCAIVELARRIGGVEVRAMGRSHSPGDITFTQDWIVSMRGVEGCLEIDHGHHDGNARGPSITVLGGTFVSDMHTMLEEAKPPLGMFNVGSISEQTIAGLISTATHGTGYTQPVISAAVERMKVVCPFSASQGGTQMLICSRTENVELFNATLCGLGATGLIVEVTLRVDHLFRLKQVSEDCPFDFVFGASTGWPCVGVSKEREEGSIAGPLDESLAEGVSGSTSIGKLLAHGHRLNPAPLSLLPTTRVTDVSQIYPVSLDGVKASTASNGISEAEEDEVTRTAQRRLDEIAQSAQFVKLIWFPTVGVCTVSRSNRTLEPIQTPSMLERWHHAVVGHRLSELLIYLSRVHPSLPSRVNRTIHYLTAPSAPKKKKEKEVKGKADPTDMESSPAIQLGSISEVEALDASYSSTTSSPSNHLTDLESFGAGGAFKPLELTLPSSSTSGLEPLDESHPVVTLVDVSHRVFNIDCLFKQYTDEWAIPLCHAASAIRAMRDWIQEEERMADGERFHFPVEIRFADADGIWMSHCQGRRTCFIGLTKYRPYNQPIRYRRIFYRFEMLMRHYAGRPHWAKAHTCGPIELAQLYPHLPDFIATMEKVDPQGVFRNPYIRRHLFGQLTDDASPRIFKARL